MTIEEAKNTIINLLKNDRSIVERKSDKRLIVNGYNYQIRPDEAFYYNDKVFIVEYENNKRPVESISKYHWLFKETAWLNQGLVIYLLFIICNEDLERKYPIRTKSVEILGYDLSQKYQEKFNFSFINYSELKTAQLENAVQSMLGM